MSAKRSPRAGSSRSGASRGAVDPRSRRAADPAPVVPAPPAAPAPLRSRWAAELAGTAWLVLAGCGTVVLALSAGTEDGAGPALDQLGIALAFGLAVTTGAYALGHLSGGHFNPAVTVGLATAGRFPWKEVPGYAAAQVLGALLGAGVLRVVASGREGFTSAGSFATNGFGDRSPGGYGLGAALVVEVVLTAVFVVVVAGTTDARAPKGFAPLAIGLALAVIHLVSMPVTGTSVNPARSVGPAVFAGGAALGQLWVFVLAPLAGAALGGAAATALLGRGPEGGARS